MKPNALFILQACALAVFLAGILASIVTFRQNLGLSDKIRNKNETLSQLAAIKQTRDRHLAALQAFEALSNAVPATLASLGRAAVTNATPEIRERESRNLTAGWTLRQMEAVFSEMNLSQLPDFLQAAEMQRPPWRLMECTLASSRQADGLGRAVLIMEAAEKIGRQMPDDGRQPARRSLGEGGTTEDRRRIP